jgi:predicted nucleic acid-binding protein
MSPGRGARIARRDERGYREYLSEDQRGEAGCPARELCREPPGQDTKVAVARRPRRRPPGNEARDQRRYTVDASVFVNAFNPYEEGHAESLAALTAMQERGDPVIVPTLLLPEIAAAVARASDDSGGALDYATATVGLPHLTLVTLTPTMARQAAELAATHRLRGADSIYVAVARRYGTTLVSRDEEQRSRGSAVVTCQTPDEALDRPHERNRPRR